MPTIVNLAEEEPIPIAESSIDAQLYPKAMGSTLFHRSFTILEEVASVKDSITS